MTERQDCSVLILLAAVLPWVGLGDVWAQPAIPPGNITASAASEFFAPLTSASLTADESGLTGDLHDNHPSGHTMWLSRENGGGNSGNNPAGVSGPTWILYEFGQLYELSSLWVWNDNQENLTDRGLRNVSIHTTADGANWNLHGDFELAQAPGTNGYAHGDEIAFAAAQASKVLITASETDGNYGSAYYGLSEVRFFGNALGATPTPFATATPLPTSTPTATPTPCQFEDDLFRMNSIEVDPVYADMLIPQASGWLGSDIGHTIPLSATANLWLFGDTLIGTVSGGQRNGTAFVNSSVGIQDLSQTPPGNVEFYWGPGNTSFFPHQPGTPGNYYWSTNGVLLEGELFIFCYSVGPGGGLGFQLEGTTLIRIPNPLDPPDQWIQNASDLEIGGNTLGFHTALFVEEPFLYMMGYESGSGPSRMVLARIATADLIAGGTSEHYEYLVDGVSGPEWAATLADPSDLATLFEPGNTETAIHFERSWGRYFCLTYNIFAHVIYLTHAPELVGPWSDPVCVYQVPEIAPPSVSLITYAARPHPELSTRPGELVLTYETNSLGSIAPLFTPEGLGIYHPRFLRVDLEKLIHSETSNWRLY